MKAHMLEQTYLSKWMYLEYILFCMEETWDTGSRINDKQSLSRSKLFEIMEIGHVVQAVLTEAIRYMAKWKQYT